MRGVITGRHVARFFLAAAGLALAALGITSIVTNRLTGHEALGFFAAILTGTAAALWLRRDKRDGGAS